VQNAQHFSGHSHSAFCLCGFGAILKTVGVCAFALGSGYAGLGFCALVRMLVFQPFFA
jgi:hypothetical protein